MHIRAEPPPRFGAEHPPFWGLSTSLLLGLSTPRLLELSTSHFGGSAPLDIRPELPPPHWD